MPPHPHAFVLSPPPRATPAASSLRSLWRVLVDAVRRLRTSGASSGRDPWERGALTDLDERMLKDIGVSEWHAANAAMRSYEDLRTRIDGGLG